MNGVAFTFSDTRLPGRAEPAGELVELAQHHIARMAEMIGNGTTDLDIATAVTIGSAALFVVVDQENRPVASSLLFYSRNDQSEFRTLYAAMVADSPDYCFRNLAERMEAAARHGERPGPFQYLDIVATGAVGLEGYSIRESEPGRVVVGKLVMPH
jgi:hypothetical protein